MSGGFVKLHRSAVDHHLVGVSNPENFAAWVWLLSHVAWKPTKIDLHGRTIEIGRGQICCSVRHLAEAWGWSKSKTHNFLKRLETETMIGTKSGTGSARGRLIITICNYDKYQDDTSAAKGGNGTAPGTDSGTTSGQDRDNIGTQKKKVKKDSSSSLRSEEGGEPPSLDRLFYQRGKDLLGPKSGGVLNQLQTLSGGYGPALEVVEAAAKKQNAMEYVQGVIRRERAKAGAGRTVTADKDPYIGIG